MLSFRLGKSRIVSDLELSEFKKLIDNFAPRMTAFERAQFVPAMRGRIQYIIETLRGFQRICATTDTAIQIDAPLRSLVDPRIFDLGVPEPHVGEAFLQLVSRQCEEEFIAPGTALLNRYDTETTTRSYETSADFLNQAATFFQKFVGNKERLFTYSFRTFLNVRNTRTGEITLSPPTGLELAIMPFQTSLLELTHVAETAIKSIELWSEEVSKQKTKHVELVGNLTQTKAAVAQAQAARWGFWFQIAVICFTMALVWFSQRANLYLEKRDLETTLTRTSEELTSCQKSLSAKSATQRPSAPPASIPLVK